MLPLLSADFSFQRIISYVNNNYSENLKIEALARLFNYNSAYMGKRFKEYSGYNFHTYLDVLRINAAKELLLTTDMKVYEISNAVGYTNTDYFYNKFKKNTGKSPLIFKKKN
jgi:two-component system response regulator YesN